MTNDDLMNNPSGSMHIFDHVGMIYAVFFFF